MDMTISCSPVRYIYTRLAPAGCVSSLISSAFIIQENQRGVTGQSAQRPFTQNSVALALAPFIQESVDFCRAQRAVFGALLEGGGGAAHLRGAKVQAEGGGALADGMATGEARAEINLAFEAEVCRVEDFVGAGVVKNGPRVNACAVGKRAARGDRRVKRDGQAQAIGNVPVEPGQVAKIVVGQQFGMVDVELRDDTAQRG